MDFDIDIEQIRDSDKRELYREAFARLENHAAEVMAEAGIYISREGKIAYLTKLQHSRLKDLERIQLVQNIDRDFSSGWFSDRTGILASGPFTKRLTVLICELTAEWLKKKITELKEDANPVTREPAGYSNSETVLIFYFGMLALGYPPRKVDSVANFARFLHALTGKDLKTLDSSDFYDKLKIAPLVTKDPHRLLRYLQNVRSVFEKAGFKEPITVIDQEIIQTKLDIADNGSRNPLK